MRALRSSFKKAGDAGTTVHKEGTANGKRRKKRRCPRTGLDIPLSQRDLAGSQCSLLRLCAADPVKLIVPFNPAVAFSLGYSALSHLTAACDTTERLTAQLAAFLPASVCRHARRLIPFITGYHLYTHRCWFGNAYKLFFQRTFSTTVLHAFLIFTISHF